MTAHCVIEKAEIVLGIGIVGREAYLFSVSGQGLFRISAVEVCIAESTERRRIIWIESNCDLVGFDRVRILFVLGELVSFIDETGGFAHRFGRVPTASLRRCGDA